MNNPFDQQKPVEGVKHIVVVGSGKGGVGKSTVTANLALALKKQGHNVGLLDADIYGPSIPRMFGAINQPPEVDSNNKIYPLNRFGIQIMSIGFLVDEASAMVWRGPMLFKAMDQFFRDVLWKDLDYLLIDLPPGTGDIPLTIAQRVPVSGAVTVTTPQNLSLIDAKKALDLWERTNVPSLGILENMSSFTPPGATESIDLFPRGEIDQYLEDNKITSLGKVPFHPSVSMGSEAGIPLVESAGDSAEGTVFMDAARKLVEQVDRQRPQ